MIPFQHPSNNRILQAPADWDHTKTPCDAIGVTVFNDGIPKVASFWTPSLEQLRTLNNGGTVVLIIASNNMPPVIMGVSEPVEEYLGDNLLEDQNEAG